MFVLDIFRRKQNFRPPLIRIDILVYIIKLRIVCTVNFILLIVYGALVTMKYLF